jgi:hypothetical protein
MLDFPSETIKEHADLMSVAPQIIITEHAKGLLGLLERKFGCEWQYDIREHKFTENTLYWVYILMNSLQDMYTTRGEQLWTHSIDCNILCADTQENNNIKIRRGMASRSETFFVVVQPYLKTNLNQIASNVFPRTYEAIFLIPSMITSAITTHHSVQERFEQTLNTIHSIKERFKYAFVLVIEGSVLIQEHRQKLKNLADHILELGKDFDVMQYVTDTRNDGYGEAKLLVRGIEYLQRYVLCCSITSIIFKLGASYRLTDKFMIRNYSQSRYTFREEFAKDKTLTRIYESGLYSIPINKLDKFKTVLSDVQVRLTMDTGTLGQCLYDALPQNEVRCVEVLGVEGYQRNLI